MDAVFGKERVGVDVEPVTAVVSSRHFVDMMVGNAAKIEYEAVRVPGQDEGGYRRQGVPQADISAERFHELLTNAVGRAVVGACGRFARLSHQLGKTRDEAASTVMRGVSPRLVLASLEFGDLDNSKEIIRGAIQALPIYTDRALTEAGY